MTHLLSTTQMREVEDRWFAAGISAETLMEQVGCGMAAAINQFCPVPGTAHIFFGKGNNGGDALVAARYLQARGWDLQMHPAYPEGEWGILCARKFAEIGPMPKRRSGTPVIVLDGLLGIGSHLPLREEILKGCRAIRELRERQGATVFALDLPTGLNADSGEADPEAVVARYTLTAGYPKSGLVADQATALVGRLAVIPFAGTEIPVSPAEAQVTTARDLAELVPPREFETHKGDFGRLGIVAGSRGMTGAAVLAATGALRAGAGLVYLYVPADVYEVVARSAPPEAMVRGYHRVEEVLEAQHDAMAIGPGLDETQPEPALRVIEHVEVPMIVDAGALNIASRNPEVLLRCQSARLLTPHPGEMKRLFPGAPGDRAATARAFTERYPVTLLLKGARTVVAERGKPLAYNSTGSPGMATGGMGDVLTGVCGALLARGVSAYDAARLGAWLCGRAAETVIVRGAQSEESLLPTDLAAQLGIAFLELRRFCF